ncbi:E3 ubiquitin-protein ligase PRT6-like isoform X1 [Magnolia sinica]|uniref:E3 ubiquitin-protein ligase PRT6-like isoform X1 n=1 Tax=Magnolia sinica TaxID=86752 RepID=UPI0026586F29|nr:E3 ubiquitin-protein ligase PRT6-like isoform X1 [Magnolia sinica]
MDIDLGPDPKIPLSPKDLIVRRLVKCGVPKEDLDNLHAGLVAFAKKNKFLLCQLVRAILPSNEDMSESLLAAEVESGGTPKFPSIEDQFRESFVWLQWLMFEDEPVASLSSLTKMGVGQRGVCGAVWGQNDIAYHCRTCEHDPTCAICVPCFQNGDHKGHDYSIMYTGGGCCDCGDMTAWKREGFCSKHIGAEKIEPLPEETANSVGPVLDAFLICWKDKLLAVENSVLANPREGNSSDMSRKAANELSSTAVDMLLNFCKVSESLLAFVSKRMLISVGLLDVLVRAERFLDMKVVKKLHEVLLKLLGEPIFKYEFAKVFINYYPTVVAEAIKDCSDSVFDKYPLLSTFSVQIFTVPTLTPRFVRELNLLGIMLGCLGDLFLSCAGKKGYLQISRWANLCETTIRLVEDIRYVMNHVEVPKYVVHELPDIARTWMGLLTLVQGMDPQKRVTSLNVEEENEIIHTPFILGHCICNIHSLLVAGAFSINDARETKDSTLCHMGVQDLDDCDSLRHAKIGRLSQESSVCSMMGSSSLVDCSSQVTDVKVDTGSCLPIPSSAKWLTFESLKALDSWLGPSAAKTTSTLRQSLSKIRKRRNIYPTSSCSEAVITEVGPRELDRSLDPYSPVCHEFHMVANMEDEGRVVGGHISNTTVPDMESEHACTAGDFDISGQEAGGVVELDGLCVLNLKVWPEMVYDVSSQDISFHLPLHRLLSLLLQKALNICYGESGLLEIVNAVSGIPSSGCYSDFFSQVLGGCHPHGFCAFVMEHPLQLRVFYAEVRAGMWRKNGDAAILSFECYRSVRWWQQGLEFDLFLLQCCAALAPPDLFVERIQERFGLLNYHSLNLELSDKYEPVLVQEMLTLIIQIVKERRFSGFSATENLRRELVYKLAIGDATHSELVRALPHDLSNSDQLQKTVDTVAVYSNPSGMKQGKYSLRKSYWKELDLYHPRWNSRDLQVAEERYLRFCKVSALTIQLPQWTKIFYPLSTISNIATSKAVLKIVRTVLFYAVFTDNSSVSRAPDGVLLTALHLLSLALDICCVDKQVSMSKCGGNVDMSCSSDHPGMSTSCAVEGSFPVLAYACEEIDVGSTSGPASWKHQSMITLLVSLMGKYRKESEHILVDASQCNFSSLIENILKKLAELNAGCMAELQRLSPDVINCLSQDTSSSSIQISATSSDAMGRKAKVRERQAAILEKMRAAQTKFIESLNPTASSEMDLSKSKQEVSIPGDNCVPEEAAPVVCSLCRDPDYKSPISYLIFLQKSRLTSFVERGPPSWEEVHLSDKEHLSIMKSEMTDPSAEVFALLDFIKARVPLIKYTEAPNASYDTSTDMASSPETLEDDIYQSIQRGIHDVILHSNVIEDDQKCSISCGLGSTKDRNAESAVLREYIASLASETSKHPPSSQNGLLRNENVPPQAAVQIRAFDGFGPTDCDGIHASSCGHVMHQECRDRYLSSLRQRFIRRMVFEGGNVADPDQGEFICPVCRRLANSVLPAFPVDSNKVGKKILLSDGSFTSTTGSSSTSHSDNCVLHLPLALSLLWSTADAIQKRKFPETSSQSKGSMRADIEPVYRMLCRMYFPDRYDTLLASGRVSHSALMWDTLRYSLIATEIAARGGEPKGSAACSSSRLEALYRKIQSSSGFILCLLLKVANATRCQNHLQVLLRFRGIQLFAGAICSGVSLDGFFEGPGGQKGNISCILQQIDKGMNFPDVEFWKRAADPVLAHDPFSSLMWVLFCLPLPFVSSTESFISLVHLFHVVCVVQALITCLLSHQFDFFKSRVGGSLINGICKIMGESVVARRYFVSKYIDASCPLEDMIRRFTAPYLRRCALLWKLLKSSTAVPFSGSSHGSDRSTPRLNNGVWGNTGDLSVELKEVTELEHMFQISSLERILEDEAVRALALKWCVHFCEEFGVRNYGRILHSTPAIPFKLMCLPQLYQDLLQRYIKQQCPDCKSVLDEPALCLLCGRLCSPISCCRF